MTSNRRTWLRGAVTLGVVGIVAAALAAAPVGAQGEDKLSKKEKKKVNRLIGSATAPLLRRGDIVVVADQHRRTTEIGSTVLNSVEIDAPSAGVLVINGSAEVDNDEAAGPIRPCLAPRVDGANVVPGLFDVPPEGEAACADVDDQNGDVDMANIAYTVAHPVAAGNRTVTQHVLYAGNDYEVNYANLVVMFVPTGSVTTASV